MMPLSLVNNTTLLTERNKYTTLNNQPSKSEWDISLTSMSNITDQFFVQTQDSIENTRRH